MLFNLAIESLTQIIRNLFLKGIDMDKDIERLIVTLFADDTTVYLRKEDSFHDLVPILRDWCKASGAKFNIPKTVIVLVGTDEHRNTLMTTRKSSPNNRLIPIDIKIAGEGEATQLLGAFHRNGIMHTSMWSPTVEAIVKDFKRWRKSNLTLEGKHLIISMVVDGRLQF